MPDALSRFATTGYSKDKAFNRPLVITFIVPKQLLEDKIPGKFKLSFFGISGGTWLINSIRAGFYYRKSTPIHKNRTLKFFPRFLKTTQIPRLLPSARYTLRDTFNNTPNGYYLLGFNLFYPAVLRPASGTVDTSFT